MRRAATLALCAGLTAFIPGAASAGSPESLTVTPFTVAQGGEVDLKLVCQNGDAGPVSSPAFTGAVKLVLRSSLPGYQAYTGSARIAEAAEPGEAKVLGNCGPRKVTGYVRVTPKSFLLNPVRGVGGAAVTAQVGCETEPGPITSLALAMGPLRRDPQGHQPWALRASGTVRPEAKAGPHPVTVTCGDQTLRATFTVLPAGRPPQVQHPPAGGVETGDGSGPGW